MSVRQRALEVAGVDSASEIDQSDISKAITLRDRGREGVDQSVVSTLITLRDRAQSGGGSTGGGSGGNQAPPFPDNGGGGGGSGGSDKSGTVSYGSPDPQPRDVSGGGSSGGSSGGLNVGWSDSGLPGGQPEFGEGDSGGGGGSPSPDPSLPEPPNQSQHAFDPDGPVLSNDPVVTDNDKPDPPTSPDGTKPDTDSPVVGKDIGVVDNGSIGITSTDASIDGSMGTGLDPKLIIGAVVVALIAFAR